MNPSLQTGTVVRMSGEANEHNGYGTEDTDGEDQTGAEEVCGEDDDGGLADDSIVQAVQASAPGAVIDRGTANAQGGQQQGTAMNDSIHFGTREQSLQATAEIEDGCVSPSRHVQACLQAEPLEPMCLK